MTVYHFKFLLIPALGILLSIIAAGNPDGRTLRVAVAENVSAVEISGAGLKLQHSGNNEAIGQKAKARTARKGVKINGKLYRSPVKITSADQLVYLDGSQYRGEMVIHPQPGGMLVVNELPMEVYLVGLINAEAHSTWPVESLKAQAVAARTYALYRAHKSDSRAFDVRATVADQVYHGSSLEDRASYKAVNSTRGEILLYKGKPIEAFYHSTCGGKTASAKEVWGVDLPYLKSVECKWCVESPRYFWKYSASGGHIGEALKTCGHNVGKVKKIKIIGKTDSLRNRTLKIKGSKKTVKIKASLLRKSVGYTKIFSTRFEVFEPEEGMFLFLGRGSGHGVGMCQWGARGMALDGRSYRDILNYYYPGCRIAKKY